MESNARSILFPLFALFTFCCSCGSPGGSAWSSPSDEPFSASTIQIRVSNVRNAQGSICYTLVNELSKAKFPGEGNPADGSRADCIAVTKASELLITIAGIPFGTYAISLFHDIDGNGRLNTGLFGAPTEPLGLSTIDHIPLRVPKFDECSFVHNGATEIAIELKKIF